MVVRQTHDRESKELLKEYHFDRNIAHAPKKSSHPFCFRFFYTISNIHDIELQC